MVRHGSSKSMKVATYQSFSSLEFRAWTEYCHLTKQGSMMCFH
jgi:hypothetical protein